MPARDESPQKCATAEGWPPGGRDNDVEAVAINQASVQEAARRDEAGLEPLVTGICHWATGEAANGAACATPASPTRHAHLLARRGGTAGCRGVTNTALTRKQCAVLRRPRAHADGGSRAGTAVGVAGYVLPPLPLCCIGTPLATVPCSCPVVGKQACLPGTPVAVQRTTVRGAPQTAPPATAHRAPGKLCMAARPWPCTSSLCYTHSFALAPLVSLASSRRSGMQRPSSATSSRPAQGIASS